MRLDVCDGTLLGKLHVQASLQQVPVEYISALDVLELNLLLCCLDGLELLGSRWVVIDLGRLLLKGIKANALENRLFGQVLSKGRNYVNRHDEEDKVLADHSWFERFLVEPVINW